MPRPGSKFASAWASEPPRRPASIDQALRRIRTQRQVPGYRAHIRRLAERNHLAFEYLLPASLAVAT